MIITANKVLVSILCPGLLICRGVGRRLNSNVRRELVRRYNLAGLRSTSCHRAEFCHRLASPRDVHLSSH